MELSYRVVLRTRSTDRDYFWVGDEPEEWWAKGWGDSLLRRQPCYLCDLSDGDVRLLLTGVVSGRRDGSSSQTLIRYELAMRRSPDGAGLPQAQVDWLIRAWWQQRLAGTAPWRLGLELDDVLRREAAAQGMSVDTVLEQHDAVTVESALRRLPKAPVMSSPKELGHAAWVGSNHPEVPDYLHGSTSLAYFAAVNPTDAEAGLGLRRDVLAIADGDSDFHPPREVQLTPPKGPAAIRPQPMGRYQIRLWAIVLLVLLLAATVTAILV